MIDVVLVRHATTAWTGQRYCGRGDPPLDEAGRVAALELARTLAPTIAPGTRLISSPRVRARQTAEAIAVAAGIARIDLDERWAEADVGLAEGRTFDELEELEPDLARRLASGETAIDWPGGEPHASLLRRVQAAWLELDGPSIIVSHAGPIRAAAALATGRPEGETTPPVPGGIVRIELGRPVPGPSRATLVR